MNSPERSWLRRSFRRISRTLFGQIAFALAILFLILGPVSYFSLRKTIGQADDHLLQLQMWETAQVFAEKIAPSLQAPRNQWAIQKSADELNRLNPIADIYLVDNDGTILFAFAKHRQYRAVQKIRTEPILQFLSPDSSALAPIYGDDPQAANSRALISVAPLTVDGRKMYLYATYRGQHQRQAYELFAENYLFFTFGITALLSFLLVVFIGAILFFVLTRRVTKLVTAVTAFRDGDYQSRSKSVANDELGELGVAFDDMADRIASAMTSLEDRDALRRELIAAVSHDLRGPLGNILAQLEQMGTSVQSSGRHVEQVAYEAIRRNALQLGELLSQLFELAKLEAKETVPELEHHYIESLFEDLVISYRPKAIEGGIELSYDLLQQGLAINADLTMVGRVLGNLIENALRFTKPGGRVSLQASAEGARVRIAVIDSGSGMEEAELKRIFEQYYQTSQGKLKGLSSFGLGLAIVRRLVELQGSQVHVTSVVDVGTEFYFSLPMPPIEQEKREAM